MPRKQNEIAHAHAYIYICSQTKPKPNRKDFSAKSKRANGVCRKSFSLCGNFSALTAKECNAASQAHAYARHWGLEAAGGVMAVRIQVATVLLLFFLLALATDGTNIYIYIYLVANVSTHTHSQIRT